MFTNVEVAPSKGNLYRNIDPANVAVLTMGKYYNENEIFPENIVELRNPYVIRGLRWTNRSG